MTALDRYGIKLLDLVHYFFNHITQGRLFCEVSLKKIIFDCDNTVGIPGYPMDDAAVKEEIGRLVQEIEGGYFAVVTIDHPIFDA